MLILCPACQTELAPTDTACPICLRARSPQEMVRSLQGIKREERGRRRRKLSLFLLLALAGLGSLGYRRRADLLQRLQQTGFSRAPAETSPPQGGRSPAALPQGEGGDSVGGGPKALPQEPPLPPPAPLPAFPDPTPQAPDPAAGEDPTSYTLSPPKQAARDSYDWTVRGKAYELLELRPVSGLKISFQDKNSGRRYIVKSGPKGLYRASLPRLEEGGYMVSVSHKDYKPIYLEEAEPPYHRQRRSQREEAGYAMSRSQILHVPILLEGQEEMEYNLILLPRP